MQPNSLSTADGMAGSLGLVDIIRVCTCAPTIVNVSDDRLHSGGDLSSKSVCASLALIVYVMVTMASFHLVLLALCFSLMVESIVPQVYDPNIQDGTAELSQSSKLPGPELFLDDLVEEYGSDGKLTVQQLEVLLSKLNVGGIRARASSSDESFEVRQQKELIGVANQALQILDATVQLTENDSVSKETSPEHERPCYSTSEIMQIHNLEKTSEIDRYKMSEMCPAILHQIGKGCSSDQSREEKAITLVNEDDENLLFEEVWLHRVLRSSNNDTDDDDTSPTTAQIWGYSFLCVTIINLCSLIGVIVVPFMNKKYYQYLLMFLICLAVGTLSGSALLHLIPEAHGIQPDMEYLLKSLTVIGGIYLFFLTEKLMKIYVVRKKRLASERQNIDGEEPSNVIPICSVSAINRHSENRILEPVEKAAADFAAHGQHYRTCETSETASQTSESDLSKVLVISENGTKEEGSSKEQESSFTEKTETLVENGNSHFHEHNACANVVLAEDQGIATVAYMVILGDGLHNFIDGLTVGAAFSISIISGVSVCIAIFCEEFPHELGDFAILLNAGMSVKKALCYNFLSACMCYLGLVIGIILAELTEAAEYIFAIAGGMFLYISLVDMLPEINAVEEKETNMTNAKQAKIFIIQNSGLLTGWGLMLLLGAFEDTIAL
ncbi:metal cation symporter ZIP14-like [Ptychodera flava]|uniref:metal cation symporter ZIP14-like n=1 Tax=Ptychodera flava TaxID=63121 RepID=UPI00396A0FE1